MDRFNQKRAKEIAQTQLNHTLDCILGNCDPDYSLSDDINIYEQNFEEDLQEKGINPTPLKIKVINKQYQRMVDGIIKYLEMKQKVIIK